MVDTQDLMVYFYSKKFNTAKYINHLDLFDSFPKEVEEYFKDDNIEITNNDCFWYYFCIYSPLKNHLPTKFDVSKISSLEMLLFIYSNLNLVSEKEIVDMFTKITSFPDLKYIYQKELESILNRTLELEIENWKQAMTIIDFNFIKHKYILDLKYAATHID